MWLCLRPNYGWFESFFHPFLLHHYRDLTAFFLQKQLLHGLDNALKDAQVGEAAPDPSVYDLASRKTVSLLTTATPGRPLVLNFGSCS